MTPTVEILCGDCGEMLRGMPAGSVDCIVTSPPYYGLRDYGVRGQIGLEETPQEYVERLVGVFREARRVLSDAGTLWLNLGDSYSHGGCGARDAERWPKQSRNDHIARHAKKNTGVKPKELLGIPWRVALALQADAAQHAYGRGSTTEAALEAAIAEMHKLYKPTPKCGMFD
jgi:hypothetical protein